MRASLLLAGLCACASPAPPSPREQLAGIWDRYDESGFLIDRLKLDGAGAFHAIARTGSIFGDFSDVTGAYRADDERLWLTGTSADGFPFEVVFTYHANETQLVRGAYLLDPAYPDEDVRRYNVYYRQTLAQRFTMELDGTFAVDERGGPSFLVWYTDPIWGTDKTDSGGWAHERDAMRLDNGLRFEVIDGLALGQHDPWHRGIDAPNTWWDTGFIYERTE